MTFEDYEIPMRPMTRCSTYKGADYMDGDQFYDFTFDVTDDALVTHERPRTGF